MLATDSSEAGFFDRIALPETAPAWMPQEFIDYTISRYRSHGFRPPLNWYRNFERSWERTAGRGDVIEPPAMFLAGSRDWLQVFAGSIGLDMGLLFKDLRIHAEIDAGHWLGQEQPDWVNDRILEFLTGLGH